MVERFEDLDLAAPLVRAVREAGYREPTPIQREAIPHLLAGRDLLGCAQTGTGKTAAFALPILDKLIAQADDRERPSVQALVLAPTRELAAQIGASFKAYGHSARLRSYVVFGGVGKRPQADTLRRGVDVLVATPGRLLDLMNDGAVSLKNVRFLVLDEADRMLDMGFIQDVRRITNKIPDDRQTMLFSATLVPEVQKLARHILVKPVRVAVDPVGSTVEPIEQKVYFVAARKKIDLLVSLLENGGIHRALVFTRTKHGADRVNKRLRHARVHAAVIHGNKSQRAREAALEELKHGRTQVVVATDIAARGLDIKGLSHVINYDMPNDPENYVHRVGRTGRAGESGVAVSFCAGQDEVVRLMAIEKLTGRRVDRVEVPAGLPRVPEPPASKNARRKPQDNRRYPRRGPRDMVLRRRAGSGKGQGSTQGRGSAQGQGSAQGEARGQGQGDRNAGHTDSRGGGRRPQRTAPPGPRRMRPKTGKTGRGRAPRTGGAGR